MENKGNAILEGLNSEQAAAVSCVDGPVLIVAGAGSGKTRVLTSRIAYILAEKGCDPARILALTFTKKAASEMKERIALMVGEKRARRLYMGTFHSVFIRFLREFAESLGYPTTFTIYDKVTRSVLSRHVSRNFSLTKRYISRRKCFREFPWRRIILSLREHTGEMPMLSRMTQQEESQES